MEMLAGFRSSADLGMDDSLFFQEWPIHEIASSYWEDVHQQPAAAQVLESSQIGRKRALEELKTDSLLSTCSAHAMVNSSLMNKRPWCSPSNLTESIVSFGKTANDPCKIMFSKAQDHIFAERKRREKLNQRFIALSALLPGLKKMDKASILGNAINHMKELENKVKRLEEQSKKTSMECVKKYEVYESGPVIISESLPVIEARFCNKQVFISIRCHKRKGVIAKIVAEIEKLNLSIVNTSVMTYGDFALNITLIAECFVPKDKQFSSSMKEIVNDLRGVLKILM